MKTNTKILNLLLIAILALSACSSAIDSDGLGESDLQENSLQGTEGLTGTADAAQVSSNGGPDYGIVFPQDKVNEITITISAENWALMMEDMTDLYGPQGSGQRAVPAGNLRQPPENDAKNPPMAAEGQAGPPVVDNRPGRAMKGGNDDQNPIWVDAEISFNGKTWEHVGFRFKGNSSLKTTWGSGSEKLPFKLDFDEFEDEYPETENQRFYGFKQLSFSSNFHDDSLLREKVAADLFREAGVPAAQTAFYAVSIDYGEGPVYLGLYTAVEVVDDTLVESQFNDDGGNVYKPEGAGATFATGSFSEASFDKETNQDENDYSDILALYDALHAKSRTSDPESWREGLETVFDVGTFLRWLAVNTVIENWDTYGVMSHNYYLYQNPATGQLVWIPWDNNEALKTGGGMKGGALPLDLGSVDESWPLISYLRDDPVYYQQYLEYVDSFLDKAFALEELAENLETYHELIAPYVLAEGQETTLVTSQTAFNRSVSDLLQHIITRIEAAETLLGSQN